MTPMTQTLVLFYLVQSHARPIPVTPRVVDPFLLETTLNVTRSSES